MEYENQKKNKNKSQRIESPFSDFIIHNTYFLKNDHFIHFLIR